MTEKSQSKKSSQVRPSNAASLRERLNGTSQLPNVSQQTAVIAQLQRMSPPAIGQLAGPVLELMNLIDSDLGGAEMIGAPVYQRMWDEEGNLRQPFLWLIEWYLKDRPRTIDPLAVAGFICRIAAVVATLEEALKDAQEQQSSPPEAEAPEEGTQRKELDQDSPGEDWSELQDGEEE
jgi:hypothetical protein